ncbi:helix-turn-helix domain-containing protein, partial [Lactobacillus sp. UMNPBX17]|uniref:helix-turn-helix domain-containing protein n=1 Tax=Lactobacillus sp. UMNPBX17 TaxID=2042030 RepID=UPI000BEED967
MKRMSSLAYHFGVKLRFYPSSKQKKIIKLNYDAQRFVYNSYVGRNRSNYHAKHYLAVRQYQAMPFAFSILNNYETKLAEEVVANSELLAKPKNIRDTYSFLRVKEIDSLAIANAIQNYQKAWSNYRKIGHGIPTFHKKRSDWSYQTNCQYPKQKEAFLDNGTA